MVTLNGLLIGGGIIAALGTLGCDRESHQDMGNCEIDMASGAVICNQKKTSLEDVRAFYQETLPGLSNNSYRMGVSDKQGTPLGEMVLVDGFGGDVYQHGWFECPAGCKAIVEDDGSVYIELSGNSNTGGN